MTKNIILVGFMGSGKSTLARKLATKLNMKFIDTDSEIELRTGYKIQDLFKTKGELYFREQEQNYLNSLEGQSGLVIATGGGMPCFSNNMDLLNSLGETIYLKLSSKELSKRLKTSKQQRPLIENKSEEELELFVNQLLTKREQIYMQSKHILNGKLQKVPLIINLLAIN